MAQQFDVSVKLLFERLDGAIFPEIFDGPVIRWLNIELPKVENRRLDLLAQCAERRLVYIEIDAQNRVKLLSRMARNCYTLKERRQKSLICPVVYYIGREPMTLPETYETEFGTFRYKRVDMSKVDVGPLIDSTDFRDNLLALLGPAEFKDRALDRVQEQMERMESQDREDAATLLLLLGALRDLEGEIMERIKHMFTMQDILRNKVLGPAVRVREKKARQQGERRILRTQIEQRFGKLSPGAEQRLESASEADLTRWAAAILSAGTVEEVFQ
ncbi:MAG: hypothetical protein FJW39_17250 [Acidobacteria bacterium]|nr:hypothetical protein [Acidobacteriota bacterium]